MSGNSSLPSLKSKRSSMSILQACRAARTHLGGHLSHGAGLADGKKSFKNDLTQSEKVLFLMASRISVRRLSMNHRLCCVMRQLATVSFVTIEFNMARV